MPHKTIEEVAEVLNRPVEAILQEIIEGELIPSVGLGPMRGYFWEGSTPPQIYIGETEGWDWDGERTSDDVKLVNSGTWYVPTCSIQIVHRGNNHKPYIHILKSLLSLQRHTDLWFGPEELIEREDDRVYLADMVVNDEELTRYEQDTGADHSADNLSTRERNNLLREVAILVRLYVADKKSKRLGAPDDPNISQVVNDILDHVSSHNINEEGLGGSTLRTRIKDALDILEKTANAS